MKTSWTVRWVGAFLLIACLSSGSSVLAQISSPVSYQIQKPDVGPPPAGPDAPTDILYNQTANQSASGWTPSSHFTESNLASFTSQAADDFVNNTNTFWHITKVTVAGLYDVSGSTTVDSELLQFFNDAGTTPARPGTLVRIGDTIPAAQIGGLSTGLFVINLPTALTIGPAHYWLSAQANKSLTASGENRQWAWRESTTVFFAESTWQNPGGGYSKPCPTWQPRVTVCHLPNAPQGNDLVFMLEGTTSPIAARVFLPIIRR